MVNHGKMWGILNTTGFEINDLFHPVSKPKKKHSIKKKR